MFAVCFELHLSIQPEELSFVSVCVVWVALLVYFAEEALRFHWFSFLTLNIFM